jgi:acetyltransferase EpsM
MKTLKSNSTLAPLVIWGASGHARVVADIFRLNKDFNVIGFLDSVDPSRRGMEFFGARVLGGEEQLESLLRQGVRHLFFGIGNCQTRLALSPVVRQFGFELAVAVHPGAIVAGDVNIGAGTVIMAGAVVNPASTIQENVIINTSSSIDHDCLIESGVHIGPGVHLGGGVEVGKGTWIGIGAIVKDKIKIGAGAIVGAGAVVLRDIPDGIVAYGVPAKIIRSIK